ncbi:hypothetical protein ONE63_000781 [Megalurothrips usitatus]|uniref:Origin recognition complex subunit 1 n=1 Tax=Megalurothrips usitatus TaxID=439358 RepID=A0AAV7Y2L9_9NEOP|nr:hypothetical protein ONE63_000781 [Megalurothrips usitatus]
MTRNRTEVLTEKNMQMAGGKTHDPKDLKSSTHRPRRKSSVEEIDVLEDVKENVDVESSTCNSSPSSPVPSEKSCETSSRHARVSRAGVRRSLVSDLDGPPSKQTHLESGNGSSSLSQNVVAQHSSKVQNKLSDAEEDADSSCKHHPKDASDSEEVEYMPRSSTRRSARKTKCTKLLAESTDSDSESKSLVSSSKRGKGAGAPNTPSGQRTPRRKQATRLGGETDSPAVSKCSSRNGSEPRFTLHSPDDLPLPKPRTPSGRRTPGRAPQYYKEADSDDFMSPPKSRTPSSRRTPGRAPQYYKEADSDDLMSPPKLRTPSSRRTPAKTPQYFKEADSDDLMSLGESDTSLKKKTPNRNVRVKGERTPKRATELSSKTPKSPKTPRAKTPSRLLSKGGLTPSMPARTTAPLTPMSSLEQVRKNLHVSAVPTSLPCRESEYRNIYNFLENKIGDAAGGCMYISGVPGTGKTATVHAVIRSLKEEVTKKNLKDFQYIEVNGLRMTEPRQVFVQVLKSLTGQKCTPQQAQDILAQRFCSGSGKNKTIVLLVDEVDMLRNRRQDVIYNLFDWPSKPNSQFIVLTIANTMDLPERLLKGRVTSRLGLTRLTFQPYSYKQLQEIVMSRLQGSNSFNDDAVELVARKVAACSGDVRRALDICRRASEFVEEGSSVTMPIINQVLSQMMNSANVCSIKACSTLEKLFLQAVVAENERTGVEETMFISVYRQFVSLCALASVSVINISEAMAVLSRLGTSGLLLVEHSRADINQSIFLNVNADDIHYALNQVNT